MLTYPVQKLDGKVIPASRGAKLISAAPNMAIYKNNASVILCPSV